MPKSLLFDPFFSYLGTIRFTRVPPSVINVGVGDTFTFTWEYTVGNGKVESMGRWPRWSFYTSGGMEQVIAEQESFSPGWISWMISKSCPDRLLNPVRVFKWGSAYLTIYNITIADNGIYGCTLRLSNGTLITSKVHLIVTGTGTLYNYCSLYCYSILPIDHNALCF